MTTDVQIAAAYARHTMRMRP
ncbi:hypothetical protein EYZ11_001336 [Aspergillus tanneri]|uniref:Uncharacterized protein n=1 Tax=Aspergillus tanneri TaxID=1220188 RepID=A0A4S3JUV0_9EURO|nr:hypothetical protein EYZ11_001336 [Aspergillus tanneri]